MNHFTLLSNLYEGLYEANIFSNLLDDAKPQIWSSEGPKIYKATVYFHV